MGYFSQYKFIFLQCYTFSFFFFDIHSPTVLFFLPDKYKLFIKLINYKYSNIT